MFDGETIERGLLAGLLGFALAVIDAWREDSAGGALLRRAARLNSAIEQLALACKFDRESLKWSSYTYRPPDEVKRAREARARLLGRLERLNLDTLTYREKVLVSFAVRVLRAQESDAPSTEVAAASGWLAGALP